jgi:hypothetical protein
MALRTLNLLSGRIKNRLWWSRWCAVSRSRKAMRTHLLPPGHQKKLLGRSRWSKWLSLRIHNLPSGRIKKRLWWIRWSDVSRSRKAIRTHFLHPEFRLKRLGRSRINNFLSRRMALRNDNLPYGRLITLLSRWSDVSKCRKAIKTHFRHPEHRKKRLRQIRLRDVLCKRRALRILNFPSPS